MNVFFAAVGKYLSKRGHRVHEPAYPSGWAPPRPESPPSEDLSAEEGALTTDLGTSSERQSTGDDNPVPYDYDLIELQD